MSSEFFTGGADISLDSSTYESQQSPSTVSRIFSDPLVNIPLILMPAMVIIVILVAIVYAIMHGSDPENHYHGSIFVRFFITCSAVFGASLLTLLIFGWYENRPWNSTKKDK
jgi:hypothetical protein